MPSYFPASPQAACTSRYYGWVSLPLEVEFSLIQWSHAWSGKSLPISSHTSLRSIHPSPGKYEVLRCSAKTPCQAAVFG